jgi:acyl-CoA synthetase (AMP-forming)/AMP-acid ligase II
MLANLAAGVTSVIPDVDLRRPGSVNPGSVARTIEDHRVTRVAAPPALLERLVDHCSASARTLPGLERVCTGGGPVLPGLLERVQRIAPRADVLAIYGSSEAEPIASLAYAGVSEADRRTMQSGGGLLAGIPVPAVRLRIVPDADQRPPIEPRAFEDWCLPHGQAGEILVSGPHVLTGYLDGEGDEATKLRIGDDVWHRTGDAGLLDEVGRLWLLGRCAAAARDARGTLYPFAVECAALQHPNVRRAALVASRGRRTLAVELRDPRDSSCLAALRTMLIWADLDAICDYGRLPLDRRHNSKIDYRALGRLVDSLPATPGG